MTISAQTLRTSPAATTRDIQLISLKQFPGQRYYLAGQHPSKTAKVLVLVHGIARNAELIIRTFWKTAKDQNLILVAPLFDRENCTDYQRLGRNGKGPRADLSLKCILHDVAARTGWQGKRAAFFGHSAGAQFVHRYMFAHPQTVACAALSAAGWYTFPSNKVFPRGIQPTRKLPDLHFEPSRFLRIPTAVFVGLEDVIRDETLNAGPALDRQQGVNRLERARNWVRAMQVSAQRMNLPSRLELFELEKVGHDFEQAVWISGLHQRVIEWTLENTAAPGK